MSRSRKGSKGPGYDYWSGRPQKKRAEVPGRKSKKVTIRMERTAAKRLTLAESVALTDQNYGFDAAVRRMGMPAHLLQDVRTNFTGRS